MTPEKRPITVDDLYKIVYVEDPRVSPDGQWIAYVQVTIDKLENGYKRNIWLAPSGGGAPTQLTRGGKDTGPRWSPDGKTLAFASARGDKPQIYLLPIATPGGEARALTQVEHGASAPDWSPCGKHIAFLARSNAAERAQEDSGAEDAPPADKLEAEQRKARKEHEESERFDPLVAERIPYREGTAYLDDRHAQIYVIAAEDDDAKPRRLTDTAANHDPPRWTSDGAYLLTARSIDPDADEPWRWRSLFRVKADDGSAEQLTGKGFNDTLPLPSPDGKWIAYVRLEGSLSFHDPRIAVIPAGGGDPRDLVAGLELTPAGFEWARDASTLVFSGNSWGSTKLYTVPPEGGEVSKRLEEQFDIQDFDIDAEGNIAFVASTPLCPPELFCQAAGTEEAERLTDVNAALLDEVIVQPTHEMRFNAPDGREIQGWYILPVGYEEGKAYPLAMNVHGGPHAMWSPSTRSMWHEWQSHAARGYVVFYCNPRGSSGYGEEFRKVLTANWGVADMPDLMAGLEKLLGKGLVDEKRMALSGGSYGGFMTAWMIGHTDRFAAAVSQRGVYNMFSMFGTTDIPMFNANELGEVQPWEDPEKYWEYSPLAYAHKIKTPLLIIHSANDFRVPVSEGEQMFAFIRRNGGTAKLLCYPREGHELSRSGEPKHRISRLAEMIDWFDKYCTTDKE